MRLTCPNCKAQYEVEDSVVPPAGRDVQCSSCGTTWFQYPASVALEMRAADLDDDDDDDPGEGTPAPAPPGAAPAGAGPRLDRTVLDVLRQEAEREMAERQRSRPAVSTQADLGLMARPRPRGATPRPAPEGAATPPPPPARPGASRGGLLPDIEELSSTLAPRETAKPGPDEPEVEEQQRGREFRRGLMAVLLVVVVLTAMYLTAPALAEMVPALAGPLAGYVALVDMLRASIAGLFGAA